MADLAELTHRFRAQGDSARTRAPFFAAICVHVAGQPAIVELLRAAPEEQQLPVLLLAALHHDVLADPECELAQWYPSTRRDPLTDGLPDALVRHCRRRGDELRRLVATRSVQTNEVGRSGLLLPVLGMLEHEVGTLSLIDVGTSAGLNLLLDRFEYRYDPGGSVGPSSPVRLEIGTRGAVPVPIHLPRIAARIGLDREPIDVTDDDAARWLRACVWPDQADRFRRLDAAIGLARSHPVEIRRSDAVAGLGPAVSDAARTGHPVVTNSWVLNYLPLDRRRAYVDELDGIGATRDLSWVFAESPGQAEGLPFADELVGQHVTALVLVRWRDRRRIVDHLGVTHPHGYWLHWAR